MEHTRYLHHRTTVRIKNQIDWKQFNKVIELISTMHLNTLRDNKMGKVQVARVESIEETYEADLFRLHTDWQVNIACQDNLEYMRNLPEKSMQLIVTSPPYNLNKEYEERKSLESYIESQATCIAEAVRLLAPTGSICWQVGNYVSKGEIFPLDILLYSLFKNHGLKLRNRIMWTFGHGLHCRRRFSGRYETILWFTKSDEYFFNLDPVRVPSKYPDKRYFKGPKKGQKSGNPLGKNPTDVWEIPNVKNNHVEKTIHPCQFPVGLVERLVLALTNEGDNVLDPYIGVGSSAIAALLHNRNAYGCDTNQSYIDISWERIHSLRAGTLRTRHRDKPIYVPTEGGLR